MFAPSEQLYLPLVIVGVSELRSDRAQPRRSQAADRSPRESRPARVAGLAASVRANIVRLIPGQTRLPLEPAAR
jgi:hypothetical protein